MIDAPLYAAIEAGGTKMVLGLGDAAGGSIELGRVDTRAPAETMPAIAAFFAEKTRGRRVAAFGIATFGPIDLDRASPTHGAILPGAKTAWNNFNLLGAVRDMLGGIPGDIDTDVNGAALAEALSGAGAGLGGDLAYVTIGTGIGIGFVVNGATVHGSAHPEAGHVMLRRHPDHGDFPGVCAVHGDCIEGLACGPAIKAAWGKGLDELPSDHPAWAIEADYVAQICAMLILNGAPHRIVLGGGVMSQQALFGPIRDRTAVILAGYGSGTDRATLETRIVPPACIEPPGLIGAYLIAARAAERRERD